MTTNPNAPFGFRYVGRRDGSPPNFGNRLGYLASNNSNAIFTGDVLTVLTGGYLDVQSPTGGGAPIGGIAGWFEWNSVAFGYTIRQNWWPGNGDNNGVIGASYYADPSALFEVQALLGPITQADVGKNANYDVGGGGSETPAGTSSFSLTSLGSGASLPFTVYGLPNYSPNNPILVMPGYDPSSAYNIALVTIHSLTA